MSRHNTIWILDSVNIRNPSSHEISTVNEERSLLREKMWLGISRNYYLGDHKDHCLRASELHLDNSVPVTSIMDYPVTQVLRRDRTETWVFH